MASPQQPTSVDFVARHGQSKILRKDPAGEVNSVLPFPKAKPWQCSVYYFWWCFLKEHEGYRKCCENDGKGPYADLYRDFGDVRGNNFRSWWKNTGSQLFAEHPSGSGASVMDPVARYQVLGKPNLTVLHRRHQLLVLAKKFPEAPLWRLFEMSEGRSPARNPSPGERNQKAQVARRYYQEAQSILAFAVRGLFAVRSTYQLRKITSIHPSQALQECRMTLSETEDKRESKASHDARAARPENWLRSFRYEPQEGILTRIQLLIAQLVACGLSDKEISYLLGVATSTVKAHTGAILKCFGLFRRTQIVRFIFEKGQFDPDAAERFLTERKASRLRHGQEGSTFDPSDVSASESNR